MEGDGRAIIGEVASAIRQAAGRQAVVMIRLAVGKDVTVPKARIASELHRLFPQASIELKETALSDSVVVKDIEVE
jgi:hypothetical protein